jgi:UDP-glucuronate 4-epimerase
MEMAYSRDYTFVDDIVQGVIAAMHYDKTGFEIINLGNNYSVSLKELIAAIEEVTGKKAKIEQLPEQPAMYRKPLLISARQSDYLVMIRKQSWKTA